MSEGIAARKATYAGLFLVALATLMYEILLTRIFSVTLWYHFAFFAISIAMFGMTLGALLVYLRPSHFTEERAPYHLSLGALLFAVSATISFVAHLGIPLTMEPSLAAWALIALTYLVISVPFVFSGICVCLALTKFPRQVNRLYAADLSGAALGCMVLIYTLKITDGPTAVIAVSLLAATGAVFFATDVGSWKLLRTTQATSLLLAIIVVGHTVLVHRQSPILRLKWVKGEKEPRPLYEKWNSFSRIQVLGDPNIPESPTGYSRGAALSVHAQISQLHLNIDASADTILTAFHGDLNDVQYLKNDMVNLVHYLRPDSRVLVVGAGGGRDILSALVFEQKSVTAVEINEEIFKTVNGRFGDFTGHLDQNPRVTLINDEARSYIARQTTQFDIIQISFIDTWAATAAGAFVLAESPLYTVEAWKTFLEHLTPRGIATVSRWYFHKRPAEMYRLTSLAATALMQMGVSNPRNHIVIVRLMPPANTFADGIGTILVSRKPFSQNDWEVVEDAARKMRFEVVLTPKSFFDNTFAEIASGKDLEEFADRYPLNIVAPTDDSPFFFHLLRFRNVFDRRLHEQGVESFNANAVFFLIALLVTVVILTLLCIVIPLILTGKKATLKGASPLFVFFAAIGFGFMLVEISQLQRLIIFLGHPTYGLSVVLFALLLSSGLGSYLTRNVANRGARGPATLLLLSLLGVLALFGLLTPHAIREFQGSITPLRILMATATLFPLGLFMGMAFPLGMKVASQQSSSLTPWLWGINGASSVCASVLAVVIAMSSGISVTFWVGFGCYILASAAFVRASREK